MVITRSFIDSSITCILCGLSQSFNVSKVVNEVHYSVQENFVSLVFEICLTNIDFKDA